MGNRLRSEIILWAFCNGEDVIKTQASRVPRAIKLQAVFIKQ